ncbi:MAG: DUF1491 family protein [Alphaproteobacteria bacterium]|jgi:GMP synthase (glutamine-hydrolysing)|nr:DUF1491 family protein [Alphaproteobacteria bacterium]HJP22569.1 DUF1491 family protein [Alphaproteobacteria bacterium]
MEPRLKTDLWIKAIIKRCLARGIPATVARRGDGDAGMVFVKLNRLEEGCIVYSRQRDYEGSLVWTPATGADPVPEVDADTYLQRQLDFDPDLWILEIEDRDGWVPFADEGVGQGE